jgi:hypothetical protein
MDTITQQGHINPTWIQQPNMDTTTQQGHNNPTWIQQPNMDTTTQQGTGRRDINKQNISEKDTMFFWALGRIYQDLGSVYPLQIPSLTVREMKAQLTVDQCPSFSVDSWTGHPILHGTGVCWGIIVLSFL